MRGGGILSPMHLILNSVLIGFYGLFYTQNLTQKELATKICEKPQIVNEYESGKAIPNQAVLAKMERALEIKLRGKDKGAPLAPKAPKKGAK